MGTLPSVPMVYAGVLDEGVARGEDIGSTTGDAGMLDDGLAIDNDPCSGHFIAIDSVHGVFRLAAKVALRRASSSCLSPSGMVCRRALRRAFLSCLSLFDILCPAALW